MKQLRVLHILDELNTGGAERIVVSYFQNIHREQFQWDFIITQQADHTKRGLLEPTVEQLGGRIYRVPRKRENYLRNITETAKIIKNGHYDIVHSHLDELSAFYLASARQAGVPLRICHSHLAGASRGRMVEMLCKGLKPLLEHVVTDRFACGLDAGKSLWGEKAVESGSVYIMKNAIASDRFRFQREIRDRVRREMHLENHWVVGTVGRLSYQKNSLFLIDIMKNLIQVRPDAVLLVVGEGDLLEEMQWRVKAYDLPDHVRFLGGRSDVHELMMAMDVFLLPSRFEGLPIVLVEAQCSGLPCIISDTITQEVIVTQQVYTVSINAAPDRWAEVTAGADTGSDRQEGYERINEHGYDILQAARALESHYLDRIQQVREGKR